MWRVGAPDSKSIETPAEEKTSSGRDKFIVRGNSLLYHAFFQPDDRFLTFVLFQANCVSNSSSFEKLFHKLPVLLAGKWKRQQNLDKVKLLLQTKDVDLNTLNKKRETDALRCRLSHIPTSGDGRNHRFHVPSGKPLPLAWRKGYTEKALEEMKGHRRMLDLLEAYM